MSTAEKSFICWGKYCFLPLSPLTCVMIFPLKTAHQREGRDEFLTFSFSVFEILMRLCDACDDCRSRLQSTGLSVNFFNGRWILLTKGATFPMLERLLGVGRVERSLNLSVKPGIRKRENVLCVDPSKALLSSMFLNQNICVVEDSCLFFL